MKKKTIRENIMRALTEKGSPHNSGDNTNLSLLADRIRMLPLESDERHLYVQEIRSLSEILSKLSIEKIRNLCKLITLAKLPHYEYSFIFSNALKKWKRGSKNIIKRAEIFRLICESGMCVDSEFVVNEKGIKKAYPWYWIDAAACADWQLAFDAIREQLEKKNDVEPILLRLSRWRDFHKSKKAFRKMLEELLSGVEMKKHDLETIELFFKAW